MGKRKGADRVVRTEEAAGVRPFGFRDKLGYLFGDFGNDFSFIFASTYLMVFYMKVLGIGGGIVGALFLAARGVDAFTDVTMGRIVDHYSRSGPEGRFRPWIRRMCVPVAVSSTLMYLYFAQNWPYGAKLAYMIVTYVVWGSFCYTAINIPYGSMASVITADAAERTSLSTYRSIGASLASLVIGSVVPLVIYETDAQGNQVVNGVRFTVTAALFGLFSIGCYLLCYFLCMERVHFQEARPQMTEEAVPNTEETARQAEGAEGRIEESRTEKSRTEEGRTEEGRIEEGRTEGSRTEEGRAEEGRAEDGRTEESYTEEGHTEQNRTEDIRTEGEAVSSGGGFLALARRLLSNRPLLSIVGAALVLLLATMLSQTMNTYLFLDYFKNARALTWVNVISVGGMLLMAPFAPGLSRRVGKKESGSVAVLLAAVVYILLFFLQVKSIPVFILLLFLGMTGMGYFNMIIWAFITDVIDYQEVVTGKREDGTVYAVYSFARKVGQALAGGIGGFALAAIGYVSDAAAQTDVVAGRIYVVATLIPGLCYFVVFFIMLFGYPLGRQRVEENTRLLQARHEQ